jgi:catechol 2,3-dioxygenase-like lactoylglutathione lyase family enzyme
MVFSKHHVGPFLSTLPPLELHHGAVSVPDLEASILWYGRVLGLDIERRFELEPAQARGAMLRRGDLRIELFEVRDAASLPEGRGHPLTDIATHGNKHVALSAPRLDGLLRWLSACDIEPVLSHTGPFGTALFIHDNSGNLLEFIVSPSGTDDSSPSQPGVE